MALVKVTLFLFELSIAFWTLPSTHGALPDETYRERAMVTPLPGDFVALGLKFTTTKASSGTGHYSVFPQVIAQLLRRYSVDELHLSLVQGRWRHNQWGYPPYPQPGGTGANIWAYFNKGDNKTEIDAKWKNLINSLSGLFCASLESIDKRLTVTPHFLFDRMDHRAAGKDVFSQAAVLDNGKWLRYGTLPSESLCTENLTPWKKLMPCKSSVGLSSFIHPTTFLDSHYLSMSLDVRKMSTVADPDGKSIELVQTLNVVTPRPMKSRPSYTVEDIVSAGNMDPCPFAIEAIGSVETTRFDNQSIEQYAALENTTKTVLNLTLKRSYTNFDLRNVSQFKKFFRHKIPAVKGKYRLTAPLEVHCYLAGIGQHRGSIVCQLRHTLSHPTPVVYAHIIPWYIRVWFHTFKIDCNTDEGKKIVPVDYSHIQPAKSKVRPHFYEAHAILPPKSVCETSISYEKLLQHWVEYPPDANRGFWVPSPVVKAYFPWNDVGNVLLTPPFGDLTRYNEDNRTMVFEIPTEGTVRVKIWGEVMLAAFPTPDFSMPFNVICLVCTVVALAFGPVHTLTTKNMIYVDEVKGFKQKIGEKLTSFKLKVLSLFGRGWAGTGDAGGGVDTVQ